MTTGKGLPLPSIDALPLGAHRLVMLTDEHLFEATGVRVAFTTRRGGVSSGPYATLNCATHVGDDLRNVERNRELVCEAVGADADKLVVPNQVHGTNLVTVQSVEGVASARHAVAGGADGVLVTARDVPVLMIFADCLPLIVAAPSGAFVVVHAGWRGAIAGIAGKAARSLSAATGEAAAGFNAYIGPHIRAGCFEVSAEIAQRFLDAFGERAVPDERHMSLVQAVSVDLVRAGLDPARIADACVCTKCRSEEFFSYRASGGTCGRHAAVAVALDNTRPS